MFFPFNTTMRQRLTLACMGFSFFLSALSAQVKDIINGVVTDSASNAFIDSVNVSSEGISVKTNSSGAFSLVISTTGTTVLPESNHVPTVNWNPKNGLFSWSALLGNVSISVQDVRGRVIMRYASTRGYGKHQVSLADLHQGVYLAAVTISNQTTIYKILRLQGDNGVLCKTIVEDFDANRSLLAKEQATTKSHVLVFTKSGYNQNTMTVAAGTASGAAIKVKLTAGGGNIPGTAIDSVSVSGGGANVTFKTSLVNGELYLLKAFGTVGVGTDQMDAEFGGFGAGGAAKDTINGVDVGIDIGTQKLRQNKTGREKWAGPYNPNHVYYMLVTGTGIPLTLKLVKSGTAAAAGSITAALVRLSPYPPQIAAQPLDSVFVPVIRQIVHTTFKPAKSAVYLLQCSGQGHAGGNNAGMGDADYMDYDSTTGAGAEDIGDCNTDYGVGIDDTICKCNMTPRMYWWGPWRKDRFYYTLYTGTGNPITILFFDSGYGDNSTTAKLKVKVYSAP